MMTCDQSVIFISDYIRLSVRLANNTISRRIAASIIALQKTTMTIIDNHLSLNHQSISLSISSLESIQ